MQVASSHRSAKGLYKSSPFSSLADIATGALGDAPRPHGVSEWTEMPVEHRSQPSTPQPDASEAMMKWNESGLSRLQSKVVSPAILVFLAIAVGMAALGCGPPRPFGPLRRPFVSRSPAPPAADPSHCSNGIAVEDPSAHPGLVEDCETLLLVRDRLAGDGRELYWSGQRSILEWRGVEVDDSEGSLRVVSLRLYSSGLEGEIPPDLGKLSHLSTLMLYENRLKGTIPPELANLSRLEWLDLDHNQLTGSIPEELGTLTNLRTFRAGANQLTGGLPASLGNLSQLWKLNLAANQLTSPIPAELGNLSNLETWTSATTSSREAFPQSWVFSKTCTI